ncbi:plasmid pRiA4b ORF-3 family protein [Paracandidimonas lactea]|nr:plasmid pRiA4b ORF-3 family protein [Paracandidimonas lactea]
MEFMQAMADPAYPEHTQMPHRHGDHFDPTASVLQVVMNGS